MPRISVCLTHYNRPDKLGATLESLAQQTRVPDEVFVWDDCSPTDPTDVIEEWKARFPHFVYHRNDVNLGMPGNLNAVIAQATGDYVANLHDADVFDSTLLEKWANALDENPNAGLVFCRDSRWTNERFVKYWVPEPKALTDGKVFFKHYFLGRLDSIIWGTVMMRRKVYEQYLPFDGQFLNWADVDMWMRVCANYDIAYVPENLISLDQTPTPQRKFSFYKFALVQRLTILNIKKTYSGIERLTALRKQNEVWRGLWWRWMLGGFIHGDWARIGEGPRYFKVN
jgi:glycosyltransferase involved in cell wall biosynthesis